MNFNLADFVGLRSQASGAQDSSASKLAYFKSKVPQPVDTDLETGILSKYQALNYQNRQKSVNIMRRSSASILIDDFRQDDEDKVSKLSQICGSEVNARFFLEAAGFNLQEAEQIYRGSHKSHPSSFPAATRDYTVNVTLKFANDLQFSKDYSSRSIIWEIGSDVFRQSSINSEFSVFIEELSKSLSSDEMSSMTFADLNLARVSFMILT